MPTKLNWEYQNNARTPEYRAEYKGLVLRAVHDDDPSNPFTDGDCNWPIVVRSPNGLGHITYTFGERHRSAGGHMFDCSMFSDAALVHNQHHIAKVLDSTVWDLMECHLTEDPVKHCWEAELLRDAFDQEIDDCLQCDMLSIQAQLCEIAGVAAYCTTVTGHHQGDWAEVLVIATPEACQRFGVDFEVYRAQAKADPAIRKVLLSGGDLDAWIFRKASELMLESTAELYGHWAFGDVYGYVVCRPGPPTYICSHCRHVHVVETDDCSRCGEMTYEEAGELEELDSCWGYYGPDFDESGLEEQAMSSADYHTEEKTDA